MPRSRSLALALALTAAPLAACTHPSPSIVVQAGPAERASGLTATGAATVGVAPDCADLLLTLTADSKDPAEAIAQVRARQDALVAELRRIGVADADLTLSQLGVDAVYDWTSQRSVLRGFQARTTLTATTRRFDQIGDLMEAAADAGATEMSSRFRRSDLPELKKQVRDQAIAAAQAKAKETAAALGVTLGRLTAVSDASQSFLYSNEYFAGPSSGGGGLGADLQPLTVEVTLIYDLPGRAT